MTLYDYETYASAGKSCRRSLTSKPTAPSSLRAGKKLTAKAPKRDGDALAVGPNSTVAFGEALKAVLKEWKFPDPDKARFDLSTNDITIGGKPQSSDGKGVRAILHAAFNVALLSTASKKSSRIPAFWSLIGRCEHIANRCAQRNAAP